MKDELLDAGLLIFKSIVDSIDNNQNMFLVFHYLITEFCRKVGKTCSGTPFDMTKPRFIKVQAVNKSERKYAPKI